jgi:competence protein ComEA
MFRTSLSIAVLSTLLIAQSHAATVAQTKPAGSSATLAATATVININSASVADLQTIPGIGAKTAELIVEYRQKNGPFKKVEELMNIRGIGEKNFLKMKPQITVAPPKTDRASQQ